MVTEAVTPVCGVWCVYGVMLRAVGRAAVPSDIALTMTRYPVEFPEEQEELVVDAREHGARDRQRPGLPPRPTYSASRPQERECPRTCPPTYPVAVAVVAFLRSIPRVHTHPPPQLGASLECKVADFGLAVLHKGGARLSAVGDPWWRYFNLA